MGRNRTAMTPRVLQAPNLVTKIIAATLAAAVGTLTLLLVWAVAVPNGPDLCAAVMPPIRNCFESQRMHAAGWWSAAAALATASVIALELFRSGRWRATRIVAWTGFALVSAATVVASAWIPALA